MESLQREMPLYIPQKETQKTIPVREIPPHNGFGDEEDSKANCYRLILKPPKEDPLKLLSEEIKLTFSMKLFNPKIEDQNR
jgi:hypothetical protein